MKNLNKNLRQSCYVTLHVACNRDLGAASKSKHPEIKKLAQDIISSQQAEISQMKQWRLPLGIKSKL
ncbi:hypothetical protein NIES4071_65610 [Calothrix sp. NIES-4071]|nr:hypothetical protein NIES4071_65610 [Calothrix sp. NIES-4071]BAZ60865.1 hypothetical protein NIES4105_65570 [Calothrix sp. NIES-4105]